MLDRDKSIVAQAVIKSLLESPACPKENGEQMAWIGEMFPYLTGKIEDYAKIEQEQAGQFDVTPYGRGPTETPKTYESHLSDERVAEGIAKESDKFHYASEAQCKRAYAISMANKWEKWQVKSLAQRFGFSDTRKIPSKVYDAFVRELQAGPKMENGSSHLQ